jgi:kinesin family protein 5
LYEDTCSPLVQDVINGYNATIFAYGQTGTGKTFTMEGNINDIDRKGIIPRSFESLYQSLNELHSSIEYSVKVSYIEIYMERIKDLLEPTRSNSELVIREDKTKGIYISGVTEATVESYDELLSIMTTGSTNRAVAATKMNEGSSRSHSVFSITVSLRNTSTFITKVGKLVLVDLAGSEMVKKTNAQGQQLEEAKTINKSLSALGQVINALACEKQGHIPFRDSKLTRILQDSLGGNSKTVLVVNISASIFDTSETLSTLRFGMRAKGIQTRVTMNQLHRSVEELELLLKTKEEIIDTLLLEIDTLKQENLVQTAEFEQQLKLHTDTLGEKQVEFEQLQTSKTLDDTWLIEEYILEVVKLKEDLLVERNAKTELVKQIEASNVTLETLRKRVSELEEVNATLLVSANESSEAERLRKDLYELQVSTMKQASTLKLLTDELQLYKTKSTQGTHSLTY